MNTLKEKIVTLATLIAVLAPVGVSAQSTETDLGVGKGGDDNAVVCAAYLPCDEEGRVPANIRGTPCELTYLRQCARFAADQLSQCAVSLERAQSSSDKKIARLERRLRAARFERR
jgi:hypothetical protein